MFYEQTKIDEFLLCSYCHEKFDEPRILPCGKSVCNNCLIIISKTIDKKDNSFKCSVCQESHRNAGFPVNEPLKQILKILPDEVYRCDLVEKFKANLNELNDKKMHLEKLLATAVDQVKEHCLELRLDVDLTTELAIEEINKQRDSIIKDIKTHRETIIKEIDDYEAKTVGLIETEENTRNVFKDSIKSFTEFFQKWKSYLSKVKIDDNEVAEKNSEALKLIQNAEKEKRKLNSFIFNKKKILFDKKQNAVEKGNIGLVKFKSVGNFDLNEFKKIDMNTIMNGGYSVQVYPLNDGSFYLLYCQSDGNDFCQITIDKDKNIISPLKTSNIYSNSGYKCSNYFYKKFNDNVFACYYCRYSSYSLSKLNLDLSVVKTVNIGYQTQYISATSTHVYYYYNNQLYLYNHDLVFLRNVGLQNNPTGAFYLPPGFKQFEINKGKIYFLSNASLQILKEDTGVLVKSVGITAENFIIDSDDNIVLINNATKEINYFDEIGNIMDHVLVENFTAGLKISTRKYSDPLFYNDTTLLISPIC